MPRSEPGYVLNPSHPVNEHVLRMREEAGFSAAACVIWGTVAFAGGHLSHERLWRYLGDMILEADLEAGLKELLDRHSLALWEDMTGVSVVVEEETIS